jgi:hypothetical protein
MTDIDTSQVNPPDDFPLDNADDVFGVFEAERIIADSALPVTLHGKLVPIDADGVYVPDVQDANGVVHFFAAAETDAAHELRYYRVAETDDGRIVHDAHPVMPLADAADRTFPRDALETMLIHDELDSAIELAHITAESHGLAFPEPEALPPLQTAVEYGFEGGLDDYDVIVLEAVKSWRDGSTDHEQRVTIANYGSAPELNVDSRELHTLMETEGVESAMNLAESIAVASGYLHDGRDDTRLFTEGPPDPFTTNAERDRVAEEFVQDYGERDTDELPAISVSPTDIFAEWADDVRTEREANAHLEGAAWFEATFRDNPEIELLTPLDDTVNYAVVVTDTDPWTTELLVEKFWRADNDYVGMDMLTIDTYDSDGEIERDVAQAARATLLGIHEERGLEAMMRQAELGAMGNGYLDGDRADTRLFREGPTDRFETLAYRVEGTPNPYWNTSGERIDRSPDETAGFRAAPPERVYLLDDTDPAPPQPEPGSWEELLAAQPDEPEAPERHYWQTHYRPVETPDGEPLGTALFVTEFPQLPPDFDDYIDEFGMSDADYPTEARTVEMAHFASESDAAKFDAEFRGYLVPGLLDGPELAPEVAKLEGLSGEWHDMDYDEIVGYMSGKRTIVREESHWRLHDPNAERETEGAFKGIPVDSAFIPTDSGSGEPPTAGLGSALNEGDDWHIETRLAITPDAQPLGTLLVMAVYPADFEDIRDPSDVPPHQRSLADEERLVMRSFDAVDRADEPVPDDSNFHVRTLDLGHFETLQAAKTFEADFRASLVPGLLDGPELATEVAKLEGLSGEWQERTGQDLIGFMNDRKPVILDPEAWHLHDPAMERLAREPDSLDAAFDDASEPSTHDLDI